MIQWSIRQLMEVDDIFCHINLLEYNQYVWDCLCEGKIFFKF